MAVSWVVVDSYPEFRVRVRDTADDTRDAGPRAWFVQWLAFCGFLHGKDVLLDLSRNWSSAARRIRDTSRRGSHLLDDALAYLAILHAVGDEAKSVAAYQNALRLQSGASTRRTERDNGSEQKSGKT